MKEKCTKVRDREERKHLWKGPNIHEFWGGKGQQGGGASSSRKKNVLGEVLGKVGKEKCPTGMLPESHVI